MAEEAKQPTSNIHLQKVRKSTETQAVQKMSSFKAAGIDTSRSVKQGVDPRMLMHLVVSNNTLPLCIEAMEVNVDGTGHDIVAVDDDTEMVEAERIKATSFFKEPYPKTSMIKLRREVRRYLEATGNAYIELLPNAKGEVVMMRCLNTLKVSLGPLSSVVQVTRSIERDGQLVDVQMNDRERSYIYQEEGLDPVYLIEFGATQQIHSSTGRFSLDKEAYGEQPEGIPMAERGNQIIHLKMNDDPNSDYGIPRWLSQAPSIVGSRKAEEQNLEFFDAGGIPNVIVFVKGGALASSTTEQLNGFLSGNVSTSTRAAVVEVASTSGSIDKGGSVDIQVERFGSEAMGDKMYESYDDRTSEHVRLAFRLPALFIGKTSDYNYATAKVAYQVAEAQVFKPDRDEFDTLMNHLISKGLGLKTVAFKSRPITLNDIDAQLKAIETVKPLVEPKDLVAEVSRISNVPLVYVEGKEFGTSPLNPNNPNNPQGQPTQYGVSSKTKPTDTEGVQNLTPAQATELAKKFAKAGGLLSDGSDVDEEEVSNLKKIFGNMPAPDKQAVADMVSLLVFGDIGLTNVEVFNQ